MIIFSIDLTNIQIESTDLYGAMYESLLNKLKKTPTNRKKLQKHTKQNRSWIKHNYKKWMKTHKTQPKCSWGDNNVKISHVEVTS